MRNAIAALGFLALASCATLQAITVTPQQIYAAENFYVLATDAATLYAKSCNGGILPPSCHDNIDVIDLNLDKAQAAYLTIRGYEANPPRGAAATFIASVTVIQSLIPPTFVRQVK